MSDLTQLDRIEHKVDKMTIMVAAHRAEIKWLKAVMSGFFACLSGIFYKIFGP